MRPDETYQLLRNLTSPIVAITSERGGKRNGMISDSAVRASIVPAIPRVSVYIHKFNLSHDLIFDTGRFAMHLLRNDQFELIHRLGFTSGPRGTNPAKVPTTPAPRAFRGRAEGTGTSGVSAPNGRKPGTRRC